MVRTSLDKQMQGDNTCYTKAVQKKQRTFTLVEQDRTSPRTILFWIMDNIENAPQGKLEDAFELAMAMRFSTVVKKSAD